MATLRNVLLGLATIVAVFFLGRYSVTHEQNLVKNAVQSITTTANKELKTSIANSAEVLNDTLDAQLQNTVGEYKEGLKNVQDNFSALHRLSNPGVLVKSEPTGKTNSSCPATKGGNTASTTTTYRASLADESLNFLTRSAADADACAVYYNQLMDRYTNLVNRVRAFNKLNSGNQIKID